VNNGLSIFDVASNLDIARVFMRPEIFNRVVKSIAETTRYPTELLSADADLENDLGIDSVKRLEIVVGLSDEFRIPLDKEERDPNIRTIGDVAHWVAKYLPSVPVLPPTPVTGSLARDVRTNGLHTNGVHTNRIHHEALSSAPEVPSPVPMPTGISATSLAPPPVIDRPANTANYVVHPPARASVPAPQLTRPVSHPPLNSSSKPLAGRVALVTGSGQGVGRTIARLLASRGATVVVNSFHSRDQGEQTASDIVAQGGSAIHLWGSVTNSGHVDQIFSEIQYRFGRLDMLVCNASDGRIGSFMELTADDWDRAFRTNVSGHHHCVVKAAPMMRSTGGGSIVTMSAVGAHGFIDGLGSQGVVKAAVESMTRYLACELGQFGIRVNCVVGGPVYGDLLSKFPSAQAAQNHWESMTPDGELCSAIDLANAIGFLVSDEARGINGSIWNVDHGFSAVADGRSSRARTNGHSLVPNSQAAGMNY
jgi:enoyl-[acyl-carrier protein] reductase III